MGMPVGDLDYINIDNLPLDAFSMDLFSADELLNQGSSLVFYNGYDYLGNTVTGAPSFNDFFTQKMMKVYTLVLSMHSARFILPDIFRIDSILMISYSV